MYRDPSGNIVIGGERGGSLAPERGFLENVYLFTVGFGDGLSFNTLPLLRGSANAQVDFDSELYNLGQMTAVGFYAILPAVAQYSEMQMQRSANLRYMNEAMKKVSENSVSKNIGVVDNVTSNTKVIKIPEVKSSNAIKASQVTERWDDFLGKNTTNINPTTGKVDSGRIFSNDGTRSIRFNGHEMKSMGNPKFHYHEETWTYDSINDTMTITNFLQRIKK